MKNSISHPEKNISCISLDDRELTIIGTAHVSHTSVELVGRVIREQKPQVVCIELCARRYEAITNPDSWRKTDVLEILKGGKAYVLMAQLALASFQRKIAKKLDINPGQEMREAIKAAEEVGARIELIDRDVRTTLKRAWAATSLWALIKLFCSSIFAGFGDENAQESEIERLKETDVLSALIEEFGESLPGIKTALIDERDLYMTAKLSTIDSPTTVAVVGAGHVPGMERSFGQQIDIAALEEVPPSRGWLKIFAYGIPLLIVGIFVYGFTQMGADTGKQMVLSWILANGLLSALFSAFVFAHPLAILTAFVAAPITSLNPTIAAGWVAGLVQALVSKPTVSDFETIADDVGTLKGILRNRLSHVLAVLIAANLGSAIGTFVGGGLVASLLGQ